jgi:hypothetical protein
MSSSIWTLTPWRVVEAQHQLSTRKLVDSAEEQVALEEMIERSKPPAIAGRRIHYLLATPVRYPPLRHGSRFGTRYERGIWYGSETIRTAFAEVAYYRLLFLEGTGATLGAVTTQHTAFTVRARTDRGVDLGAPPFVADRDAIASPASYAKSQALGRAMRGAGVELFRYPSARDAGGVNVAAFSPGVFGSAMPRDMETWHCTATSRRVEAMKNDYFGREVLVFDRMQFLVDGGLPLPAV